MFSIRLFNYLVIATINIYIATYVPEFICTYTCIYIRIAMYYIPRIADYPHL